MAKKSIIVDDLDKQTEAKTVSFSLDKVDYEIDLNSTHAQQLRDALEPWIKAGRKVTGRRTRGLGVSVNNEMREYNRRARKWALSQGKQISDRGRVAKELIEEYKNATGDMPPEE